MSTAQRIQLPDGSTVNLPRGGVEPYQKIADITTESEVHAITINEDMEGNPLEFTDFVMKILSVTTATSHQLCNVKITQDGVTREMPNMFQSQSSSTSLNDNWWQCVWNSGLVVMSGRGNGGYMSIGNVVSSNYVLITPNKKITKISVSPASAQINFMAGAKIKLYVR